MIVIALAGPSCSGKSTLARALARYSDTRVASTSKFLRDRVGPGKSDEELLRAGELLDLQDPGWIAGFVSGSSADIVVLDCVRSDVQTKALLDGGWRTLLVNVVVHGDYRSRRAELRGRKVGDGDYLFRCPDLTWDSHLVPVERVVSYIRSWKGSGLVDVVIGGQYGSEGKGKLCSLLAPDYGCLVRSGGPNAGHWVRDRSFTGWSHVGRLVGRLGGLDPFEFCYHHLPSGTAHAPGADILIAAGATINPLKFASEVFLLDCRERLLLDDHVITISDRDVEAEQAMVGRIGSTAQGVGEAQVRRIRREVGFPSNAYHCGNVSQRLHDRMYAGTKVLIEGTQGSGLSLYHGPYPYVTSRDTNVGGLLAEVGIAPSSVGDIWAVVRTYPIRVAGNSGPMRDEVDWAYIAQRSGVPKEDLVGRERTSTTGRNRRVGLFDVHQYREMVRLNRPTKVFLTFADYLTPDARGVREWAKLPSEVRGFVDQIEEEGVFVAGISTGRDNSEVVWR